MQLPWQQQSPSMAESTGEEDVLESQRAKAHFTLRKDFFKDSIFLIQNEIWLRIQNAMAMFKRKKKKASKNFY